MSNLHQCPACNTPDFRVIDSRPTHFNDHPAVRRRRRCRACRFAITTYEIAADVLGSESDLAARIKINVIRGRLVAAIAELDGDAA